MRAVVHDRYGPPEVLRVVEIPEPAPGPGQVLVRVAAVSLNLSDWECLRGTPAYARIGGLRRPKRTTLGSDIAGCVEAVGEGVDAFAPGDAVYGDNLGLMGGFAEYAVAPAKALAPKPEALTFAEASTIPQAGAIALQGIREQPLVREGAHVLVNGAGGGSGAFAIQLAKAAGAQVTGVDNTHKLDFMRELGADQALDYTEVDVTRLGQRFDVVLDLVAQRSMWRWRGALATGGVYRCVGGSTPRIAEAAMLGPIVGRLTGRRLGLLVVKSGPAHFTPMADLCLNGGIRVHIDRTFTLGEVPDALRHVGAGRALGKVVVTVADL
jgi:NADPH:quinone reductase-like Zn-dependent oxidoreductase